MISDNCLELLGILFIGVIVPSLAFAATLAMLFPYIILGQPLAAPSPSCSSPMTFGGRSGIYTATGAPNSEQHS